MGKLALAAKITHVPSMYLSELPGPHNGCRQDAIDGHNEIGRRCRELGVDTIVVFDVHWLVNSEYHINCGAASSRASTPATNCRTSSRTCRSRIPGNPELGKLIADMANDDGREDAARTTRPRWNSNTARWCRCAT